MIIEEHEMIDLLAHYLASDSVRPLIVGGMAGTKVFQFAMDLAEEYTDFYKIRIIEGIQDFVCMHENIPYNNHHFYAELFDNETEELPKISLKQMVSGEHNFGLFPVFKKRFKADLIIINDGHMIPKHLLDQIIESSLTKMIIIVDPFDINGEPFGAYPTVVKTMHKLSNLVAKARLVYNVPTDIVDKRVYSVLDKSKLSKRSYGKIDDSQYVTNDEEVIKLVRDKQILLGFRKHQRLIVQDNHIIRSLTYDPNSLAHEHALTKNSIVQIVQGGNKNQVYRHLRIYHSKDIIVARPTFDAEGNRGNIHVKPANILNVSDAMHHRYKHLVYIPCKGSVTKREFYSMLKSTNHLTIIER